MRMLLGRGVCLILIGVWILRESRSNVEVLGLRLARGTRMVRPRGCYRIDALGVPKLCKLLLACHLEFQPVVEKRANDNRVYTST